LYALIFIIIFIVENEIERKEGLIYQIQTSVSDYFVLFLLKIIEKNAHYRCRHMQNLYILIASEYDSKVRK
jgi:hypothetical protein